MQKQTKSYNMKIGANVRKWRDIRGLKQQELADKISYPLSTISNIENDKLPATIHQIEDIADALEINFLQLFTDPQNNYEFHHSPYSVVGKQENHTDKEVMQTMLDRLDKKDEQFYNFMKEVITILKPNNKKNVISPFLPHILRINTIFIFIPSLINY